MRKLHERILELGGDSTWMHLPEMGIRGNTHAMMQDDNSRQIADLVCDWLVKKVPCGSKSAYFSPLLVLLGEGPAQLQRRSFARLRRSDILSADDGGSAPAVPCDLVSNAVIAAPRAASL